MKKPEKIDDIDFRNYTREEIIEILQEKRNEKLEPLIRWIAESSVLGASHDAIRLVMADAERLAVRKAGLEREKVT